MNKDVKGESWSVTLNRASDVVSWCVYCNNQQHFTSLVVQHYYNHYFIILYLGLSHTNVIRFMEGNLTFSLL